MASYHLSVKTVQCSAGRSVTAAAAYRAGCEIACEREGRVHDYTRKAGVEDAFIVAPAWAQDRAALWNAAEARETRSLRAVLNGHLTSTSRSLCLGATRSSQALDHSSPMMICNGA